MRRRGQLLAGLGLLATLLLAQTLLTSEVAGQAVARPASTAALSSERLQRLDRMLQQYVDESRIPGAVALVLRDGRPVYERAVGWRDKEAGARMTPDAIFRIASQSKAVTSLAILMLVEEGKIELNEPVSRFIPSFKDSTVAVPDRLRVRIVPATRPITIRQLLTHTAGVSYGTEPAIAALYDAKGLGPAAGFGWYTADKDEPICDTMEQLGSLPFSAQPGDAWVYGYNTDILGCVVERASGLSLDEFVRMRITEPLGMTDTHFFLPPGQRARLAAVYASGGDGLIARAPEGAKGQGAYVDGPRRSFSGRRRAAPSPGSPAARLASARASSPAAFRAKRRPRRNRP